MGTARADGPTADTHTHTQVQQNQGGVEGGGGGGTRPAHERGTTPLSEQTKGTVRDGEFQNQNDRGAARCGGGGMHNVKGATCHVEGSGVEVGVAVR